MQQEGVDIHELNLLTYPSLKSTSFASMILSDAKPSTCLNRFKVGDPKGKTLSKNEGENELFYPASSSGETCLGL